MPFSNDKGHDRPTYTAKRRALIDRAAGSSQFPRSARLGDFLLYVGHESLKTGAAEIMSTRSGYGSLAGHPAMTAAGTISFV
jgi:hypothetical protein